MNNTYGIWYKHQSNLINTPQMALMSRKEGIEAYGLYMHFSDTLHTIGGYTEYNFNDICLMLGYTKKLIKAKLYRVLNEYNLFDFYTDEDGIEYIGLEHLKEDIEALNKQRVSGSKGGKKRAENYRKQQETNKSFSLPNGWQNINRDKQKMHIKYIFQENPNINSNYINFLQDNLKEV
jgi:hypothetical protein